MSRTLRHVTIPDTHDRIWPMNDEGREKIRNAPTETLKDSIRTLVDRLLLSDDAWRVWYEIEDELRERGEWTDDMGKTGQPKGVNR